MKSHFCAPCLTLRKRLKEIRKWPIEYYAVSVIAWAHQHNCLVQVGRGGNMKQAKHKRGSKKKDEIILFPNSSKVTIHFPASKHVNSIFYLPSQIT